LPVSSTSSSQPSDPLVLLPGMNCSDAVWSKLAVGPALRPTLDEPSLGSQVDRLLDELPRRFDLVGLSLGAIVALAMARTAPERVTRLVLLAVNPHPPTKVQRSTWARQRLALANGATARELQQAALSDLLSPASLARRSDLVSLTLAMADSVGSQTLDHQLQLQDSRIDERPGLAALTAPTLIVAAPGDQLVSVDRHRETHRLIEGSELVVLPDCAHLSTLEQPEQISAAINRWRKCPL
jgi:pimeloyl-ACP methyl ester carboxylesterase